MDSLLLQSLLKDEESWVELRGLREMDRAAFGLVKRRTARSIAVGVRMEPRLHQRLQDHLDDRLRHAVGNGRNAERPRAAVVRRRVPAGSRSSPGGTALPEWAPAR